MRRIWEKSAVLFGKAVRDIKRRDRSILLAVDWFCPRWDNADAVVFETSASRKPVCWTLVL